MYCVKPKAGNNLTQMVEIIQYKTSFVGVAFELSLVQLGRRYKELTGDKGAHSVTE